MSICPKTMNNGKAGGFGGEHRDFGGEPLQQNSVKLNMMSAGNAPENDTSVTDAEMPNGLPQNTDGQAPEFPQNGNEQSSVSPENLGSEEINSQANSSTSEESSETQESSAIQPNESNNSGKPSVNQNNGFPTPGNNAAPQMNQNMPQNSNDSTVLLLVISAAVLAAGLLTAFLFR